MKFKFAIIRWKSEEATKYVVKRDNPTNQSIGTWDLLDFGKEKPDESVLVPRAWARQFINTPGIDPRYEFIPVEVSVDLRKSYK